MSYEDTELQDFQELANEPEVTEESEEQGEDTAEGTDLEALNKQLYARLKKTEAELKEIKEKGSKSPAPRKKKQAEESKESTDDSIARLELKVEGYSPEEIDFIQEHGGKKALENPIVKRVLGEMKEERQAEAAQVTSSSNKSEFERKYSTEDLRNMSTEELEKILPKTE